MKIGKKVIEAKMDLTDMVSELHKVADAADKQSASVKKTKTVIESTPPAYDKLTAAVAASEKMSRRLANEMSKSNKNIQGNVAAIQQLTNTLVGLATAEQEAARKKAAASAARRQATIQKREETAELKKHKQMMTAYWASVDKASGRVKRLGKETQTADKHTKGLLLSWNSMVRLFTIQVLHQAVSILSQHLRRAIADSAELQLKLAEIVAISDNVNLSISDWAAGLRPISEKFGTNIQELAEAAYQTVSNQIAQGEEAIAFVASASRLSMAAVASQTDAVNVLSSVINAYRLNIEDADRVSAKLFETVKLGRLRLGNLASDIGQITPIAAQLGISIDELLGSVGSLTRLGMKSSEAVTQLKNVFLKLILPTREMRKVWDEYNVSSGRALIQAYGMEGAMQKIREYADGSLEVTSRSINRIRGLSAIIEFTDRRGLQRLGQYIEAIEKSGTSYQQRSDMILATHAKQWDAITEKIRNVFLLDVGPKMLEWVVNFDKRIGGLETHLARFVGFLQTAFIPILGILITKFALLAKAHPILLAITAAFALYNHVRTQNADIEAKQLKMLEDHWRSYGKEAEETLNKVTRELEQNLSSMYQQIETVYNGLVESLKDANKDIAQSFKDTIPGFVAAFSSGIDTVKNSVKNLEDRIKSLRDTQSQITESIMALRSRAEEQMFNFGLENKNLDIQANMWAARIGELYLKIQQAAARGDAETLSQLGQAREQAFLEYKKLQDQIKAENRKTAEQRSDLVNEEAKLLEQQRTATPEDRSNILAQLEEVRRKMSELRDLDVPRLNVPEEYFKHMQDVETRLREIRKEAYNEEIRLIEEKAKKERQQNELTALQKRYQEFDLQAMLNTELSKNEKQRQFQIQGVKGQLSGFDDVVERMQKAMGEAGISDPNIQEQADAQRKLAQAAIDNFESIHKTLVERDKNIKALDEMSKEIETLNKAIREETALMNRRAEIALKAEKDIQNPSLDRWDVPPGEAIERSRAVLKRAAQEVTASQMRIREANQQLVVVQKRLAALQEEVGKRNADQTESLTRQLWTTTQRFGDLTTAVEGAIKALHKIEKVGVDPKTGVTPNDAFGGPSYGTESKFMTPGEFVMTKDSTRKMFNQFLTGNSRTATASGSNVNIGDINVTMQSHGNVNYDGRQLANRIRREIRQGTLVMN